MVRIRKSTIHPHVVIPDTSAIWFEDKSLVVNPEFDSFWSEYSQDIQLELVIPEVVKDELAFQQSTSAIKSLRKISEEILKVSQITNKKYTHKITEHIIKDKVIRKIDMWIKVNTDVL